VTAVRLPDDHLELAALYALGSLDETDRVAFEAHLDAGCAECDTALADYGTVTGALAQAAPPRPPGPQTWQRILDVIDADAAVVPPAPARVETPASPLVGRERELATLDGVVRAVCRGEGAYLSLEGVNGIGKSRLLAETVARAARAGARVLDGRPRAAGGEGAHDLVANVVARWAEVPASADAETVRARLAGAAAVVPEDERAEVVAALCRLLRVPPSASDALAGIEGEALERLVQRSVYRVVEALAHGGPVVLVLEDLHWADAASLALIEALLPLVEREPLLVLAAHRPAHPETSGRLDAAARATLGLRHRAMVLDPLDDRDTLALLRSLLGSAELPESVGDLVRRKAEGNPFYAEEIVRALRDAGALVRHDGRLVTTDRFQAVPITEGIQRVITSRIACVPASTQTVARIAAVLGRRVQRRVLERVAEGRVAELDVELARLEERRFLSKARSRDTASLRRRTLRAEDVYVFEHALTHEALYASVPAAERAAFHRAAADALEALFAERLDDVLPALAHHRLRAGDLPRAREALLLAGEQAARSAASAEALELFREAARVHAQLPETSTDGETRARLAGNLGLALVNAGHLGESVPHLNAALRLRGQWVPASRTAAAAKLALDLPVVLGRLYTGWRGEPRTPRRADANEIARLMYSRCRAQNIVDVERNFFDNFSVFRFVMGSIDPATAEHAAGMFAASGAFFAWLGLSFDVSRRFLEVAERLAANGPAVDRFLVRAMAFVHHFHRGAWGAEHDVEPALLATGLRAGMLWDADVYLGMSCERHSLKGDFAAATAELDTVARLRSEWGYDFAASTQQAQTAVLLIEQRRLDDALAAAVRYYDTRHEDALHLLALGLRAKIELLQGAVDGAAATLERAAAIVERGGRLAPFYLGPYATARLRLGVERLAAAGGKPSTALVADVKRDRKRALKVSRSIVRDRCEVLRLAAASHVRLGEPAAARRCWEEALDVGMRLGMRPELARVALDVGRHLETQPGSLFQGGDAAGWLVRARAGFALPGLERELERLDDRSERARRVG